MLAIILAFAVADLAPPPEARPGFVVPRPTADPVVRLLQQDRVDEALAAASPDIRTPEQFARLADKAAAADKTADALCLYEASLRHAPFHPFASGWDEVATRYLDLLARTENPAAEWFRQSRASAEAYAGLVRVATNGDPDAVGQLADGIVKEFPRSLFAVPAAVRAAAVLDDEFAVGKRADDSDRRLAAPGVSEADRLPVRMFRFTTPGGATTAAEFEEVARLSRGPLARRAAWQAALERHAESGDWDAARAAGAGIVATHPLAARPAARSRVLRAYSGLGAIEQIEKSLAGWRRAGESYDEGSALACLAFRQLAEERTEVAIALYERAFTAPTADRSWRPGARLTFAHLLAECGDDARRILILSAADPADTSPADDANASLAHHFADWGDHARALAYWERWRPDGGGCGNCQAELEGGRQKRIAECRAKLAKP